MGAGAALFRRGREGWPFYALHGGLHFDGCQDRVTFKAPGFHIVDQQSPYRIKTGMRMKWIRESADQNTVFTVPTLPGPYVKE